jgi:ribonuclease BN (tRNA processing enzyme)
VDANLRGGTSVKLDHCLGMPMNSLGMGEVKKGTLTIYRIPKKTRHLDSLLHRIGDGMRVSRDRFETHCLLVKTVNCHAFADGMAIIFCRSR